MEKILIIGIAGGVKPIILWVYFTGIHNDLDDPPR